MKIGYIAGLISQRESLAPQQVRGCTWHGSKEQDRYKCCSACVTNLGNRLRCKDCQQHCTAHHAPGYCLNRRIAHGEKISVKEIVAAEDYGCSNHKKEAAAPGQTSLGTVRQQQNGNSGKGRSNGGPSDDADFLKLLYTQKFLLQPVNADGNHYGKYNYDDRHDQRRPCRLKTC